MEGDVPDIKEARYRLLSVQVIPHAGGAILKRGSVRLFLPGADAGEFVDHIVARVAEGKTVSPSDVPGRASGERRDAFAGLIETLRTHRFLVPADDSEAAAERNDDIFYWNHDVSRQAVTAALAEVEIAVFGVNQIGLALVRNLTDCGFPAPVLVDHPALRNPDLHVPNAGLKPEVAATLAKPPVALDRFAHQAEGPRSCVVACSDFGGLALMREWNRRAVEEERLFYPVVLQDEVAWLGPLVVPREGPCIECLWLRRAAHLDSPEAELAVEMAAAGGRHVTSCLAPMARVAADMAAVDLMKHFGGPLPGGAAGRLIRVDLMTPQTRLHHVLKLPRCPVCSQPSRSAMLAAADDPFRAEPAVEGER